MRKFIKKELLNIVRQLDKANEILQKNSRKLSMEQKLNLLTECQQSAIEVGSKIDELEGEGSATVKFLEEYCEEIFFLSINLEDIYQTENTQKRIGVLINKISKNIQNEFPDSRREVVFLPYKASMWDSLECVWRTAIDDKEFDVYVVPIPYFDKSPDGSFVQMHYEGDLYPDYVQITDWRQYSIQKRKPDIIFIHNPYDQYNHVTTIHPDFYAAELKKYTEKLVYIPYFVHQNNRVKEEYCVLPGTMYADLVVLQSEEVREQYLKYYNKMMGSREVNEKKFIALGSPKFEIKEYNESDELPREWRNLIYQGELKRKVVFLNTHLMNLMVKYCDEFFLKIESVFEVFKKNKKVVLLWRPHPLSMETVKSMNPKIAERYLNLVNKYKQEAWGIYDESPDLHRAIAISDAYYGNYSSVAELFKHAGKPVMIMNLSVK